MDKVQLEMVKDIATVFASFIAAFVAVAGLSLWRKQLKGKSEYELARRYLIAVYKLRDAVFNVRSPFKTVEEIVSDVTEKGSEPSTYRIEFLKRWEQAQDALFQLNVELFEAEVLWGFAAKQVSEPLIRYTTEVYITFRMQEEDGFKDKSNILFSKVHNDDEFSIKIYSEVNKIENYLRKHLK